MSFEAVERHESVRMGSGNLNCITCSGTGREKGEKANKEQKSKKEKKEMIMMVVMIIMKVYDNFEI